MWPQGEWGKGKEGMHIQNSVLVDATEEEEVKKKRGRRRERRTRELYKESRKRWMDIEN